MVSSGEVSLHRHQNLVALSPTDITISPRPAVQRVPKLSIIESQWSVNGSGMILSPLGEPKADALEQLRTSDSNFTKNVSATAITDTTNNAAAWR